MTEIRDWILGHSAILGLPRPWRVPPIPTASPCPKAAAIVGTNTLVAFARPIFGARILFFLAWLVPPCLPHWPPWFPIPKNDRASIPKFSRKFVAILGIDLANSRVWIINKRETNMCDLGHRLGARNLRLVANDLDAPCSSKPVVTSLRYRGLVRSTTIAERYEWLCRRLAIAPTIPILVVGVLILGPRNIEELVEGELAINFVVVSDHHHHHLCCCCYCCYCFFFREKNKETWNPRTADRLSMRRDSE